MELAIDGTQVRSDLENVDVREDDVLCKIEPQTMEGMGKGAMTEIQPEEYVLHDGRRGGETALAAKGA